MKQLSRLGGANAIIPRRWSPPVVIAVLAAALGAIDPSALPLNFMGIPFALLLIFAIAVICVAYYVALTPSLKSATSVAALGVATSHLRRAAFITGLRQGALWGALGVVLGTGITQIVWGSAMGSFASVTLQAGVKFAAITVGSGTAAYLALRVHLRQERTQDAGRKSARASRPSRRSLHIVPLATALVCGLGTANFGWNETAFMLVASLAWLIVFFQLSAVALWLIARFALGVSGAVIRAFGHSSNAGRIAHSGLASNRRVRMTAAASVALVCSGFMIAATFNQDWSIRNNAGLDLEPDITISTIPFPDRSSMGGNPYANVDLGWAPALPSDLVARAQELTNATTFASSLITVQMPMDPNYPNYPVRFAFAAVTAEDLAKVTPDAATMPLKGSQTWWVNPGVFQLGADQPLQSATGLNGPQPFLAVDRDWAEQHWGRAEVSALAIYLENGATATEVLDQLQVPDDAITAVSRPGGTTTGETNFRAGLTSAGMAVTVIAMLIASVVVLAMSDASMRTRAHEFATLSALGATRRNLGAAAALDTGLVTSIAGLLGITSSPVVASAVIQSGMGIAPHVWVSSGALTLSHAPWPAGTALAFLAGLAAATGAGLIQLLRARTSPAVQLREAIKEGAL